MAQKDTKKSGGNDGIKLTVSVDLLDAGQDRPKGPIGVYAFANGGRLVARAELGADGKAALPLPIPKEARPVDVVVGPATTEDMPAMADLLRRGARRQSVRIGPDMRVVETAFEIIPNHWLCWFLSRCHVPGRLVKRTELDGMPIDLPVCGAEIEVYEVDPIPIIVARLPDHIIELIRRKIIEPDPWPLDVELPERRRPPFPRPPRPDEMSSLALMAERDMMAPGLPPPPMPMSGPAANMAPTDLKAAADVASTSQLRDALMRAPDLSRLLICRYYPLGVTKQLVATATTDECGRFRATFFRGCNNPDQPDLYFVAKRNLGFFKITIYAPTPVACYTRWNYACGTHVDLVTRNALAPTCPPCQPIETPADDWVAVMLIGNTPLSLIRGASSDPTIQASTTAANIGHVFANTTEAAAAGSFGGRPFGGLLRPHLEFDNALRDKGVRYYLFSWREGTTGDFQPLTGEIHRHFSYEPPGASEPVFEVYPLGPKPVGTKSLFEVPPPLPPQGNWVYPDLVENQTHAKFPTQIHAPADKAGKYQIKLDLFDAAGNLIDIDALDIIFVVPVEMDLSLPATIHTVNAATLGLVVDDDGDGRKSFVMTLHVDNHTCSATVAPAVLSAPANPCGVLNYDATNPSAIVHMPFTASHETGYATYQFTLKRGVTYLPAMSIGGADPLTDPRALPPGVFEQSASVGTLTGAYPALGLPACSMAAFSEHVRVYAMATNGWRRLDEYDALDHGAFVLAPAP